ncbi:MAG TPA: hypothetical protein EYG03_08820 [Planctomycetes bacterium]|nr:hypothetical protein [Fuerstiella sp.]HIK92067.1 hypothetical protein [Planctomycetota bacterium]
MTRFQFAVCFVATCCVPVPIGWALSDLLPLGIWYLAFVIQFSGWGILMIVAHLSICRFITP